MFLYTVIAAAQCAAFLRVMDFEVQCFFMYMALSDGVLLCHIVVSKNGNQVHAGTLLRALVLFSS